MGSAMKLSWARQAVLLLLGSFIIAASVGGESARAGPNCVHTKWRSPSIFESIFVSNLAKDKESQYCASYAGTMLTFVPNISREMKFGPWSEGDWFGVHRSFHGFMKRGVVTKI